jgi:hypothetical protein
MVPPASTGPILRDLPALQHSEAGLRVHYVIADFVDLDQGQFPAPGF